MRNRYSTSDRDVMLDENLVEQMHTSPLYLRDADKVRGAALICAMTC